MSFPSESQKRTLRHSSKQRDFVHFAMSSAQTQPAPSALVRQCRHGNETVLDGVLEVGREHSPRKVPIRVRCKKTRRRDS